MLRHGRTFEAYAADLVTATLLGAEPCTRAVAEVLAGVSSVDGRRLDNHSSAGRRRT